MDAHTNLAFTTVATAPSPASSGTTLTVATGAGALFPTAPFNVTVSPASATRATIASQAEILRVTSKGSGDNWTISRAAAGPNAARSIVVGDEVYLAMTKQVLDDIEGPLNVYMAGAFV